MDRSRSCRVASSATIGCSISAWLSPASRTRGPAPRTTEHSSSFRGSQASPFPPMTSKNAAPQSALFGVPPAVVVCEPAATDRSPDRWNGDRPEDDRDHHQVDRRRRQQAPNPPGVEAAEVDPARGAEVADQQVRDQVAGQHEEHVDADEPAPGAHEAGVERKHQVHGDGAEAIEIGAIPSCRG